MSNYFLAKSVFQHMYQRNSEAGKDQGGLSGPVFLSLQINPKSSKTEWEGNPLLTSSAEGGRIHILP